MSGLDNAIEGLEQALMSSPQQTWRGLVRQRMASVHEALAIERSRLGDPWQAAREGHLHRERKHLVDRMKRLDESEDINSAEVQRLIVDLEHHRQRVNDLVYDSVSMDIGGSE
ncbi:MAG TPA: hypothetical protein VLI04_03370 [Nocardioidaceae bacterium]|nr:hypothetical protein [Nocardioidaceae bacterium]